MRLIAIEVERWYRHRDGFLFYAERVEGSSVCGQMAFATKLRPWTITFNTEESAILTPADPRDRDVAVAEQMRVVARESR